MFGFKKKKGYEIEPDEIFLDSKNVSNFDNQQFEGVIEKPIPKKAVLFLALVFALIGLVFLFRLADLQINQGDAHFSKSENNRLHQLPFFGDRGVVYDRNKNELSWNQERDQEDDFAGRNYIEKGGFSHLLGFVHYPAKDEHGIYWREEYIGQDGVERSYQDHLAGDNGIKVLETDAFMEIVSENVIRPAQRGQNLNLTIDAEIQEGLFRFLSEYVEEEDFVGGSGVIMDIDNGDILAMTSYPEYDSRAISGDRDSDKINQMFDDPRQPFLNRAVAGLYTPGSIVKPFVGLAALQEGVIGPQETILSTEEMVVENPYNPDQPSIFRDWQAHGRVDIVDALAVSSNIYFYQVGGGFEDQEGLGIEKIKEYMQMFGMDTETNIELPTERVGNVPDPDWKADVFDGEPWRVGDTYNTSIGQYGFQLTPLAATRAVAALANGGYLVEPRLSDNKSVNKTDLDLDGENLSFIQQGMRETVTGPSGTARLLNFDFLEIAAKTGTAQVGVGNQYTNTSLIGYFPYEDPKYAFSIIAERGPNDNQRGTANVMRDLLLNIYQEDPEHWIFSSN